MKKKLIKSHVTTERIQKTNTIQLLSIEHFFHISSPYQTYVCAVRALESYIFLVTQKQIHVQNIFGYFFTLILSLSLYIYIFLFRFDHSSLINIIKISHKFTTLSSLYGCFLVFVIVFVFTLRLVSQELVFVVIGERLLVECKC